MVMWQSWYVPMDNLSPGEGGLSTAYMEMLVDVDFPGSLRQVRENGKRLISRTQRIQIGHP